MKVVVLSYNHPELTERTVLSARPFFPDSEILLVHNGSTPEHQMGLREKFPLIQHLVLETNLGFPGGANAGLKKAFQAGSSWVLFLTNDCLLQEVQIPEGPAVLMAPLIWRRKLGQVDSMGGHFQIDRAHLTHCKTLQEFEASPQKYIPGTAFWIHQDIFQATGGFDTSLEMFWEDVDLSLRVEKSGFPLVVDPRTKVLHAMGKTTRKNPHYTTYLFQRNRKKISLRYTQNPNTVYLRLWASWGQMGFRHLQKRNWQKLRLLLKAIQD